MEPHYEASRCGAVAARLGLVWLLWMPGALVAQDFDAIAKQGRPHLARVEKEPDRGIAHVPDGTPVAQDQPFPVSGPHWSRSTRPGFYTQPQPRGELIHALEHGQVVVYYDTPSFRALSVLKRWSAQFSDPWSGLIVVPHQGLGNALVLTAWRHRLQLPQFDEPALAAFTDAFRGRGPENPVR